MATGSRGQAFRIGGEGAANYRVTDEDLEELNDYFAVTGTICVPEPIRFEALRYDADGSLAIVAFCQEKVRERVDPHRMRKDGWSAPKDWLPGEMFGRLTVCVPNCALRRFEFLVKTWSENAWVEKIRHMPEVLAIFEDTGYRHPIGGFRTYRDDRPIEALVWRVRNVYE